MFDFKYSELYDMDLNELINTLNQRRKGLAYKMWKESYLNYLAISDLFLKKGQLRNYPLSPEQASPELYPPKPSIKKPECLKNNQLKMRGGLMMYE